MTSAGGKKPRVEISRSLVLSLFSTWLQGGAWWKISQRPSNNCSRPASVPRPKLLSSSWTVTPNGRSGCSRITSSSAEPRIPNRESRVPNPVAEAARPEAKTKQWYFDDYLHNPSRPEDWIAESLGEFNYWNQSALTEPSLRPALDALPEIKLHRKIFFLMGWLSAFLEGQQSTSAQAEVHEYLRTAALDKDLQLKILQAVDELDRTVTIRRKFPE
jgi:hypothetical protein